MIQKIEVKGLKSINNLNLKCTNLNLITGTNSSGKSTFLQAIMLFFQCQKALEFNYKTVKTDLNGKYISLGNFRENKNPFCENIEIKILNNNFDDFTSYTFNPDETINCFVDYNNEDSNKLNLKYLSCNRIGSQDIFYQNYIDDNFDEKGEYSIYYLEKNSSLKLSNELIKDMSSNTLLTQVNYWLNYIVNATIKTEDFSQTDIVKATYSINNSGQRRTKNVGSGVSYLLSVIVLCLLSQKNDVLIIENPEIHLHPKAQSKVCEFLYFISQAGIQLFIETHSDHIFNGIRVGLSNGNIERNKVSVNFFDLDCDNCTNNTVVEFGKRGRILNNVDGLFDQFNLDLNSMLGI